MKKTHVRADFRFSATSAEAWIENGYVRPA